MPEENARIKIVTIKDSHIENLKIKGFRPKPSYHKGPDLEKCKIDLSGSAREERVITTDNLRNFYFSSIFYLLLVFGFALNFRFTLILSVKFLSHSRTAQA